MNLSKDSEMVEEKNVCVRTVALSHLNECIGDAMCFRDNVKLYI